QTGYVLHVFLIVAQCRAAGRQGDDGSLETEFEDLLLGQRLVVGKLQMVFQGVLGVPNTVSSQVQDVGSTPELHKVLSIGVGPREQLGRGKKLFNISSLKLRRGQIKGGVGKHHD